MTVRCEVIIRAIGIHSTNKSKLRRVRKATRPSIATITNLACVSIWCNIASSCNYADFWFSLGVRTDIHSCTPGSSTRSASSPDVLLLELLRNEV